MLTVLIVPALIHRLEVAGGLVDDTPEIGNTLAHDLTLGVLDLGIIVELRAYPVRYRHRKLGFERCSGFWCPRNPGRPWVIVASTMFFRDSGV